MFEFYQLLGFWTWYLSNNTGLYCTQCLAKLPDITQDHFVNLDQLGEILIELTENYGKRIKGDISQVNLIKGELESSRN